MFLSNYVSDNNKKLCHVTIINRVLFGMIVSTWTCTSCMGEGNQIYAIMHKVTTTCKIEGTSGLTHFTDYGSFERKSMLIS